MSRTPNDSAAPRPNAILSPVLDLLLVGGLSLIVFIPLLLSGRSDLVIIGAGAQALLAATINMPHFLASYRLVYRDRATILRHKWASIYIPAILLVYAGIAVWEAQYSGALVIVFIAVSSAYLAWHYTGQVWGMMASYSYLDGKGFDKSERFLIRTGLRILLAWHVSWFLYTQLENHTIVRPVYLLMSAGTAAAFLLGLVGLVKLWRRTGRLPSTRALVAWVAIFVWYAMMARDPKAIFWVQIAHAIQYLAFPIRVEINRTGPASQRSAARFATHMAMYGVGLLGISYLISQVVPGRAMDIVAATFGEEPGKAAPVLLLMFINIHHYFTDGVIWKISNPAVRKELFAHVQTPEGAKAAPASPVAAPATAMRRQARRTATRRG